MTQHHPTPDSELEEAAQGQDLFRAPGNELQIDQAREQAEASGWLPPDRVFDWPGADTHREIVDRRQELYRAMQRLESSLARASGQTDWADQVRDALSGVDAALHRHVAEIETASGLFAEVVDRAPHLASVVDSLRREHEEMIEGCKAVLDSMSEDRELDPDRIRGEALKVLGQLAVHRQRGAELLFDAYNIDLSAAD